MCVHASPVSQLPGDWDANQNRLPSTCFELLTASAPADALLVHQCSRSCSSVCGLTPHCAHLRCLGISVVLGMHAYVLTQGWPKLLAQPQPQLREDEDTSWLGGKILAVTVSNCLRLPLSKVEGFYRWSISRRGIVGQSLETE